MTTAAMRNNIARSFITAAMDSAEMIKTSSIINPDQEIEELLVVLTEHTCKALRIASMCYDANAIPDVNDYGIALAATQNDEETLGLASSEKMRDNMFAVAILDYDKVRTRLSVMIKKRQDELAARFAEQMLEELRAGRMQVLNIGEFIEEVVNNMEEEK